MLSSASLEPDASKKNSDIVVPTDGATSKNVAGAMLPVVVVVDKGTDVVVDDEGIDVVVDVEAPEP